LAFTSQTDVPDEVGLEVIIKATQAAANTFWPIVTPDDYELNVAMLDRLGILPRSQAPSYEESILVNLMPQTYSPAN
jgi:hypothetical protein